MIIIFSTRRFAALRGAGLCLCAAPLLGCSPTGEEASEAPAVAARNRAVLSSLVDECFLPDHAAFAEVATALHEKVTAYATDPTGDTLATARETWRTAMSAWQRLELTRGFGPGAPEFDCEGNEVVGGRDFAFQLYAWPLTVACRVDVAIVDRTYQTSDSDPPTAARKGLDAVEYLLFSAAPSNACEEQHRINADGDWDALGEEELAQRRLEYVAAAASDVERLAAELSQAWSEAGGFGWELANAGAEGAAFATSAIAVSWVTEASLYLDSMTKDRKVACPSELVGSLPDGTLCPSDFESAFAGVSTLNVAANLEAFQGLFAGCGANGEGLLSLLPDDQSELAESIRAGIGDARAAVEAITHDSLGDALSADRGSVEAVHAAIAEFVDSVKTEFRAVVQLDTPACGAGDAD